VKCFETKHELGSIREHELGSIQGARAWKHPGAMENTPYAIAAGGW
jgi:hypothetical protein